MGETAEDADVSLFPFLRKYFRDDPCPAPVIFFSGNQVEFVERERCNLFDMLYMKANPSRPDEHARSHPAYNSDYVFLRLAQMRY